MINWSGAKYVVKHGEVVQKAFVGLDVGNEWVQNSGDISNGICVVPASVMLCTVNER
jgi:hypothetical protein